MAFAAFYAIRSAIFLVEYFLVRMFRVFRSQRTLFGEIQVSSLLLYLTSTPETFSTQGIRVL
jgi:hypothetical protein